MESQTGSKGDENTSNSNLEGRRTDVAMGRHELGAEGICQGRQQEHGDALRTLSASEGSQRRSLHVLDDQARGARVQETERAIARLLGTGGDQGQLSRPRSSRDSGFHGLVASAVGERQHSGSGKRGWSGKPQANVGRHGNGGGVRFGTCKLAEVYDPAMSRLELFISVAQHREHNRGALGQTGANRLLGQAPSGALERALSAATDQN